MEVTPKYKVGQTVVTTLRGQGGKTLWQMGLIKSISMKYVGQHAEQINTPGGETVIEGGTLGPLYWIEIEGSRLREAPRWEREIKEHHA